MLDAYTLEAAPAESPRIQNFIDGQFIEPLSGRYLDNIEPTTGKTLFTSRGQRHARDVELAVTAAEKAFAG